MQRQRGREQLSTGEEEEEVANRALVLLLTTIKNKQPRSPVSKTNGRFDGI